MPHAYQTVEIEAMTALQVLEFGLEVGIDKAIVEVDS